MCGRYTLKSNAHAVATLCNVPDVASLKPRWNIAPTQLVPVVRASASGRELTMLRWGLIPGWAKDPKIAHSLINARSETAATKPSFRTAMKRRRCLLPADGFYEWEKVGKQKLPRHIRLKSDEPFAFAGLWESWKPPDGDPVETCTILTTAANEVVAPYHERMPVILPPRHFDVWLNPADADSEALATLLVPYPADAMTVVPANPICNSPKYDGPDCLDGAAHEASPRAK